MTTKLSKTPLDIAATVVAYNITHTHMVAADARGTVAVWCRPDPPCGPASWEKIASWTAVGNSAVSCLCWAPPEFGNVVCGGTVSGSVCFWSQDGQTGQWSLRTCIHACGKLATCAAFGPAAFGPWVAVGFGDGSVRVYEASSTLNAKSWELHSSLQLERFPTYTTTVPTCSVTSVSWRNEQDDCPPLLAVGTSSEAFPCEIWMFSQDRLLWEQVNRLGVHDLTDVMEDGDNNGTISDSRDRNGNNASGQTATVAAWAPTLGRPVELLAVASGNLVTLWSLQGQADSLQVKRVAGLEHKHAVWQLEWNMLGNFLAASTDGGDVCLWRPDFAGEWVLQSKICADDTSARETMNTE